MNFIISTTLSFLLLYNYATLFIITFLSSLILPLPSDTALLASGAFAGQGYLIIYLVILTSFVSSVMGDFTGFFISRRYGREFLIKIGLKKLINSNKFKALEEFIVDNSGSTIFITRFIGQLGPWVNILCGLSKKEKFKKFSFYVILGDFIDALVLGLTGYFLGNAWENITLTLSIISIIIIVIILTFVFSKIYFRKMKQ